MKINQRGFSVAEVLIILVVIGLLGTVGWLVYDRQQNNQSETNSIGQSDESNSNNKEYTRELKQGYKLYENSGFYVQYPETWKKYELADQAGTTFFESPDFKKPQGEDPGPTAEAGYLLELITRDNLLPEDNYDKYINSLEEAKGAIGGDLTKIKIDSNDAVLSTIKTHGTYIEGVTFKNNKQYIFRLNAVDENKPEVKELVNNILETVQFK